MDDTSQRSFQERLAALDLDVPGNEDGIVRLVSKTFSEWPRQVESWCIDTLIRSNVRKVGTYIWALVAVFGMRDRLEVDSLEALFRIACGDSFRLDDRRLAVRVMTFSVMGLDDVELEYLENALLEVGAIFEDNAEIRGRINHWYGRRREMSETLDRWRKGLVVVRGEAFEHAVLSSEGLRRDYGDEQEIQWFERQIALTSAPSYWDLGQWCRVRGTRYWCIHRGVKSLTGATHSLIRCGWLGDPKVGQCCLNLLEFC